MKQVVKVVHAVSAIMLIIAVVINCANVTGRYLFSYPFASAEEIMLFLLVVMVFFGNSVVAYEGRQIRMDVFIGALPLKARRWLEIGTDVVAAIMSAVLIVLAWPVITMLAEFDQRSQAADFPLAIPQASIPVGMALSVIFLCSRIIISIKNVNEPPVASSLGIH